MKEPWQRQRRSDENFKNICLFLHGALCANTWNVNECDVISEAKRKRDCVHLPTQLLRRLPCAWICTFRSPSTLCRAPWGPISRSFDNTPRASMCFSIFNTQNLGGNGGDTNCLWAIGRASILAHSMFRSAARARITRTKSVVVNYCAWKRANGYE